MAEQIRSTFNHFTLVRFTPDYWTLPDADRRAAVRSWLDAWRCHTDALHTYQTFGAEADSDLLIWSAATAQGPDTPQRFFANVARATVPMRQYVTVRQTLWGITRPSQYTKVRSAQELNPFSTERLPYLIVYPFEKTAEWYLKARDERKEMMAQHIKVGKQYKDITQLLLYSFGLQDQEFVVVYETADLSRFLELVEELRGTTARLFTKRDSPLHLGVHQPDMEALEGWL